MSLKDKLSRKKKGQFSEGDSPLGENRNAQMIRIMRVIQLLELSSQGLRVEQIMASLKDDQIVASKKTIYRDLEAISQCHFPLTNISTDGSENSGIWRLEKYKKVNSSVVFNMQDLIALFLSKEGCRQFEGTPFYKDIKNLFEKFYKLLDVRESEAMSELARTISLNYKTKWNAQIPEEVWSSVNAACAEGQKLKIKYKSVSGDNKGVFTEKTVGPEKIIFMDSNAYLLAYDLEKKDHRTYAMTRISEAEMLDEEYIALLTDPEKYFSNAMGVLNSGTLTKVKFVVEAPLAAYVAERKWHESQKLEPAADALSVSMEIKVNDEFLRWLLSLSPCLHSVEPIEVNQKLLELLEFSKKQLINFKKAS